MQFGSRKKLFLKVCVHDQITEGHHLVHWNLESVLSAQVVTANMYKILYVNWAQRKLLNLEFEIFFKNVWNQEPVWRNKETCSI